MFFSASYLVVRIVVLATAFQEWSTCGAFVGENTFVSSFVSLKVLGLRFINLLAECSNFLQHLEIKALNLRPLLTPFMIKYVIQAKKNEVILSTEGTYHTDET